MDLFCLLLRYKADPSEIIALTFNQSPSHGVAGVCLRKKERAGRASGAPPLPPHLQGCCFSKSARGYTPASRLPEAFWLPPNSQPPSVSHGQMMGRFPLLLPCTFFFFHSPSSPLPTFFFFFLTQYAHPHRFEWQSCQGTVRSH